MSAVAVVAIIVCVILSAIVYRQRVNSWVLISRADRNFDKADEWRRKYFGIEVENEKIVEAYDNLGKRYAFLQKEYDELRKRHADLENKFDAEIKEFQTEHNAKYIYLEAHHEQALEEIKKQMERYADLQGKYDAVCDERDKLNESCERYDKRVQEQEERLNLVRDANQQLQDQMNRLRFIATSVQQQLDAAVKERDRLAEEIRSFKEKHNEEMHMYIMIVGTIARICTASDNDEINLKQVESIFAHITEELQS